MTQSAIAQRLAEDVAIIRSWSTGGRDVPFPEIDTINVVIGDGINVLVAGIAAALRVDFNALITGAYLIEFDGITGSVLATIDKAPLAGGAGPTFTSIVGSRPLNLVSGRYYTDETLTSWTIQIKRGDTLRFLISSATAIKRILLALRIRRLEP
jgi:hypothetical protein